MISIFEGRPSSIPEPNDVHATGNAAFIALRTLKAPTGGYSSGNGVTPSLLAYIKV